MVVESLKIKDFYFSLSNLDEDRNRSSLHSSAAHLAPPFWRSLNLPQGFKMISLFSENAQENPKFRQLVQNENWSANINSPHYEYANIGDDEITRIITIFTVVVIDSKIKLSGSLFFRSVFYKINKIFSLSGRTRSRQPKSRNIWDCRKQLWRSFYYFFIRNELKENSSVPFARTV